MACRADRRSLGRNSWGVQALLYDGVKLENPREWQLEETKQEAVRSARKMSIMSRLFGVGIFIFSCIFSPATLTKRTLLQQVDDNF